MVDANVGQYINQHDHEQQGTKTSNGKGIFPALEGHRLERRNEMNDERHVCGNVLCAGPVIRYAWGWYCWLLLVRDDIISFHRYARLSSAIRETKKSNYLTGETWILFLFPKRNVGYFWLVGELIGWLARLIGWLVGWLGGWFVSWFCCCCCCCCCCYFGSVCFCSLFCCCCCCCCCCCFALHPKAVFGNISLSQKETQGKLHHHHRDILLCCKDTIMKH